MGRVFLVNVGSNASHCFNSPIFEDGTFEFIPIPEDRDLPGPHSVFYRDLRSYNNSIDDLRRYIPRRFWDWPSHNDPEFETFTYGDNCEISPRSASLKDVEPGDLLFFLARLSKVMGDDVVNIRGKKGKGFYLVGCIEIEEVLPDVRSRPNKSVLRRFAANAHIRRGLSDPALWDRFWVFRGSDRSCRFDRAVPVNRELAMQVFRSADGSPWQWGDGRTDLQIIGSYTRSCRCILDPALPGDKERAMRLWGWIDCNQAIHNRRSREAFAGYLNKNF